MKKALIKLFVQLIFLAILACVVFAIGYVQFATPIGKYAVFLSKTSGYYEKIISHDEITWRWERLIPTNSKLLLFDASPITIEETLQGELENGQKYATILKNTPSFSWQVEASATFSKRFEKIVPTLKGANIKSEEELDIFLKKEIKEALASSIEEVILYYQEKDEAYSIIEFKKKCKKHLENAMPEALKLSNFSLKVQLPDFATYKLAKEAYTNYAQTKKDFILERIEKLKELQTMLQELSKSVESSIAELSNIN